jgi:hypothetical protein
MTKEQYIEQYLDKYEQEHPDEKINYETLREQADCEWYDQQVERGEATDYELTPEQEAISKALRKGKAVDAYGKEHKRERKENPDKREIIQTLDEALTDLVDNVTVANPERQIDFEYNGVHYSVVLTAHRPPKTK